MISGEDRGLHVVISTALLVRARLRGVHHAGEALHLPVGGQRRCPFVDARLGVSFLEPLVLLVLVARFIADLVAASGGSFLIAAVSATAYLSASTSSPAADATTRGKTRQA